MDCSGSPRCREHEDKSGKGAGPSCRIRRVLYFFWRTPDLLSEIKMYANSSLIQAMMVASSLIRLPGSHVILESLYSQAAVHLAVSVASKFGTATDKMSGNLPGDCRHTRQPRSVNGQDIVQFNAPRNCHRLTTSLLPVQSQSDRCSSGQVHSHGRLPICQCGCEGAASYARFSRTIVITGFPGLQFDPGVRR